MPDEKLRLSGPKLNGQLALRWSDGLELVISLMAHDALEPSGLVLWRAGTRRRIKPVSADGPEALVEQAGILVVLGLVLGDFRQGIWLGNGDQLLRRLSADALQGLSLATQFFWIGLGQIVRSVGSAI